MTTDRYIRQSTLPQIGEAGQARIEAARVAVIGLGALGTVSSELLARAGVGYIRIVDRDYVNLSNLQRCTLYTELDAAQSLPKTIAAAQHLSAINSEITLDPVATDVNPTTVEQLVSDVDLVIDATDNFAVRFLLNEACHKHAKTWIYAGALATIGAMMVITPKGPCLRCLSPTIPAPGSYPTCATAGVLASTTSILASYQVTAALKLIVGEPAQPGRYLTIDAWDATLDELTIEPDPDCPCCVLEKYELLNRPLTTLSTDLCGRDEYQVLPAEKQELDLTLLGERLRTQGAVTVSPFILTFDNGSIRFKLFTDGRAMIKGAKSSDAALSLYAEYIGL
jgi:adenylyltransferase/sulfurtransferase